jgi:tetratricopeptide (TPR) repeat protein
MDDDRPDSPEDDAPGKTSEESGIVRAVLTGGGGDDGPPVDGPLDDLVRGTTVGHYVVLSQLSAGADDHVYAAFDARLDRKVALKLVEVPDDEDSDAEQLRDAMITSAMRSGGLDHPAIVQVLDAGTVGTAVYVAMEFIDGIDLRQWMEARDEPFPWPEVLRVFREAGAGLAAAHAAGCVHGDFTPSRVFLEKSGRICVFDFGLATPVPEVSSPGLSADSLADELGRSRDEDSLVQRPTGAELFGTPRYLAPELHAGMEPDAKADQFAFCAAMYEALYGEVPFKGESPATIASEALSHAVRPAPADSDVPPWLRDVLLKGLSPKRRDRFNSMEALLRRLEHDPKGRRRRWGAGVALIATAAAGVGGVAYLVQHEAEHCEADATLLGSAWTADTRASLEDAFVAGARPGDSWDQVQAGMDEWTGQWLEYHSLACRVRQADDDEALLERRNACLDGVLQPFAALTHGLVDDDPSPRTLDAALRVVSGLWRPEDCRATDMLDYTQPQGGPAPTVDRARLALLAGDFDRAHTQALQSLEALSAAENSIAYVRAKLIAGLAAARLQSADAPALLHEAAAAASAASLRIPQAEAWIALGRLEGATALAHATTLVDAIKIDRLRVRLLLARGGYQRNTGQDRDALSSFHEALALIKDNDTHASIVRGDILLELGELAVSRDEWTTAAQYLDEVVTLREGTFGAQHPELVAPLALLGRARAGASQPDDAVRVLERAVTIAKKADLPAPVAANVHLSLGETEAQRDNTTLAAQHFEQAVAELEGTKHDAPLAEALFGLGLAHLDGGTPTRATAPLERASVLAARLGWDTSRRATVLTALGDSLADVDASAARSAYDEALDFATAQQALRIEDSRAALPSAP